jgi:hypothetical protein
MLFKYEVHLSVRQLQAFCNLVRNYLATQMLEIHIFAIKFLFSPPFLKTHQHTNQLVIAVKQQG